MAQKMTSYLLVVLIIGSMQNVFSQAQSSTLNVDKQVSPSNIGCKGEATITISLTGTSGIMNNPACIELVLDRSGSMAGTPLSDLKTAAKQFIDQVASACGDNCETQIGLVTFSDQARVDRELSTNRESLKDTIDALRARGNTNHAAAINLATSSLQQCTFNKKVMVLITDGITTVGSDPNVEAQNAKQAGIELFIVGIGINIDLKALNRWATDASHVLTGSSSDLDEILRRIQLRITSPAATNIVIRETVAASFSVNSAMASKGTVTRNGNQMTWTIDTIESETVTLTIRASHVGPNTGNIAINEELMYNDQEQRTPTFPNPTITVEECPVEDECGTQAQHCDFMFEGSDYEGSLPVFDLGEGRNDRPISTEIVHRNGSRLAGANSQNWRFHPNGLTGEEFSLAHQFFINTNPNTRVWVQEFNRRHVDEHRNQCVLIPLQHYRIHDSHINCHYPGNNPASDGCVAQERACVVFRTA